MARNERDNDTITIETSIARWYVLYNHGLISQGQAYVVGLLRFNVADHDRTSLTVYRDQYNAMRNAVGAAKFDAAVTVK